MLKLSVQKNKSRAYPEHSRRGFTLIETLVAITIFTFSIVAMITVLGGGLKDTNFAKNKMTASFLAQEGIEVMRNIRDTFVLYDENSIGWSDFITHINNCNTASNQYGCFIHLEDLIYTEPNKPITQVEIEPCDNSLCTELEFHESTGSYDYNNGNPSGFFRGIYVEQISAKEIAIISSVYWKAGSGTQRVSFVDYLSNWNK